jgi:hypothetical protein
MQTSHAAGTPLQSTDSAAASAAGVLAMNKHGANVLHDEVQISGT